jgi:hypothetical protein
MLKSMNYLTMTTVEVLKQRFKEVQTELKNKKCIKQRDFREFVFSREPQFDCPDGYDKIQNAWYGKNPNIRLTELMAEYREALLN